MLKLISVGATLREKWSLPARTETVKACQERWGTGGSYVWECRRLLVRHRQRCELAGTRSLSGWSSWRRSEHEDVPNSGTAAVNTFDGEHAIFPGGFQLIYAPIFGEHCTIVDAFYRKTCFRKHCNWHRFTNLGKFADDALYTKICFRDNCGWEFQRMRSEITKSKYVI